MHAAKPGHDILSQLLTSITSLQTSPQSWSLSMIILVKENHNMGCRIQLNILQKTLIELKRALVPGLAILVHSHGLWPPLPAVKSAA